MVKLLLEHRSPVNPRDRSGMTPLHHAVAEGNGDVALELLRKGADSGVRDGEERLAIELAPDAEVRKWILRMAEGEDISVAIS
jgi:26S proteasome non-ATPase regulatory subunit 10